MRKSKSSFCQGVLFFHCFPVLIFNKTRQEVAERWRRRDTFKESRCGNTTEFPRALSIKK